MKTPRTLLALLLLVCVLLVARPASAERIAVFLDPQWPLGGTTPEATWDVLREALEARGHTLTGPFAGTCIAAGEAVRRKRVEVVGAEVLLCVSEPAGGRVRVELFDAAGQPRLLRWGMSFSQAGAAERLNDVLASVDPDRLPAAGEPTVVGTPPSVGTNRNGVDASERRRGRRRFVEFLANMAYVRPFNSEVPALDAFALHGGVVLHSEHISGMFQVGPLVGLGDGGDEEVDLSGLTADATGLLFPMGQGNGPYLGGGFGIRLPLNYYVEDPTIEAHLGAGVMLGNEDVRPHLEFRISQDLASQLHEKNEPRPDNDDTDDCDLCWDDDTVPDRRFTTTAVHLLLGVAL